MEDSPYDCQMELIELQANMVTKRGYSENSLVDVYKLYVCGKFRNMSRHVKKMISLFGSTYCREQFFDKIKLAITRCRSKLTDEHLTSQLRVAATSSKLILISYARTLNFKCPTNMVCLDKM